jgi:hypothetical protein
MIVFTSELEIGITFIYYASTAILVYLNVLLNLFIASIYTVSSSLTALASNRKSSIKIKTPFVLALLLLLDFFWLSLF